MQCRPCTLFVMHFNPAFHVLAEALANGRQFLASNLRESQQKGIRRPAQDGVRGAAQSLNLANQLGHPELRYHVLRQLAKTGNVDLQQRQRSMQPRRVAGLLRQNIAADLGVMKIRNRILAQRARHRFLFQNLVDHGALVAAGGPMLAHQIDYCEQHQEPESAQQPIRVPQHISNRFILAKLTV